MIDEIVENLKNYRSKRKILLDRYTDHHLFWLSSNAAYVLGADKTLDFISQNVDSNEGLAMFGAYAGLIAGWSLTNRYVIKPLSKKIKKRNQKKIKDGKEATVGSWLRSVGQVGSLIALYSLSGFSGTLDNFKYDSQRVINAFAREKQKPVIEEVVGRVLPEINSFAGKKQKPVIGSVVKRVLPAYPIKKNGGHLFSGDLEGYSLNGLYSHYTGISGKVPKQVDVDFNKQLKGLWERKIKTSNNSVVKETFEKRVKKYFSGKPTTMTLDNYVGEADISIKEINNNIDWNKVGKLKGLSKSRLDLVKAISSSLNGRDLISYALTEIMPGKSHGKLNKGVFDFLLRNAGREYIELMPALYDKMTSFGPYQFTSYAVFDANGKRDGASIINLALPNPNKIPGSVMYLTGNDHHKAAYLFAINNIASLVKQLNRSQEGTLYKKWHKNKDDIIKYIATAHHLPSVARKAAKRWLDNDVEYDFVVSCSNAIRNYAEKTDSNWHSMYSTEHLALNYLKKSKSKAASAEPFIDSHRKNSKGYNVFNYIVQKGDNPTSISREFNKWDEKKKDRFHNTNHSNVVDKYGTFIGTDIKPGQQLYLLARRR